VHFARAIVVSSRGALVYDRAMSLKKYMILPIVIFAVGVIYWFLSYETAGAVMLVIFAAAMALFGWTLLPTAANVGHTAPVDPDFEQPSRR
jgi:hypothetical protein